jgi:hypothetical protein
MFPGVDLKTILKHMGSIPDIYNIVTASLSTPLEERHTFPQLNFSTLPKLNRFVSDSAPYIGIHSYSHLF